MNPVQAGETVAMASSVDEMTKEQEAAVEELEAFRFDVEEPEAEEADLETGCLSCS